MPDFESDGLCCSNLGIESESLTIHLEGPNRPELTRNVISLVLTTEFNSIVCAWPNTKRI